MYEFRDVNMTDFKRQTGFLAVQQQIWSPVEMVPPIWIKVDLLFCWAERVRVNHPRFGFRSFFAAS